MKTKELAGFKIGDVVKITAVKDPEVNDRAKMIGRYGTVEKLTKSSGVATLRMVDNGESWGSFTANIELVHRGYYDNDVTEQTNESI